MLCKILLYVRNILLDHIFYLFCFISLFTLQLQSMLYGWSRSTFFRNLYDNIIGTIGNGSNITEYK